MLTPSEAFSQHPISFIAKLLIIVGALNWLGIALNGTNYVYNTFGNNSNNVYLIVGFAGLFLLLRELLWLMK